MANEDPVFGYNSGGRDGLAQALGYPPGGTRVDADGLAAASPPAAVGVLMAEMDCRVEFYDLDPMNIVYHGNYPRFMEQVRGRLLDLVGYNYRQMEASGYAWPVVEMNIKYVAPLQLGQVFRARAELVDFENRLKIAYTFYDPATGRRLTKAHTVQMAVDVAKGESLLATPTPVLALIRDCIARQTGGGL